MTHLIVSGLNYHSCPIAIRERFAIPQSCTRHALEALSRLPHVKEAVLLSTCNRTEVYAVVSNIEAGWREIDSFFASAQAISDHGVLRPNFKLLREDVALHLMRVASGLDSMVLGEGQIMAQIKEAHQSALEAKTAGPHLDYLFKLALECGKRVRSETSMGKRAVSVSSAALELARNILGSLKNRDIAVIGAGKMAQICMKLLLSEKGTGTVSVTNRSPERIESFLANNVPNSQRLKVLDFGERHDMAARADVVIVSTSAPRHLIDLESLRQSRAANAGGQTIVIDISVPRNVDPKISELEGISLYHADDLAQIVSNNLAEREALVKDAEVMVFDALEEFHSWQRSLLVVPTIAELREKIEAIRQEQMAKTGCADRVEEISRAIVNQILHHPTVQLKATRDYQILRQQAEALRTLFNLDPLGPPSERRPHRRRRVTLAEL